LSQEERPLLPPPRRQSASLALEERQAQPATGRRGVSVRASYVRWRTDSPLGEKFKYIMASVGARAKEIPGLTRPVIRRDNVLLAKLPNSERLRLIARCEPMELAVNELLCEQHKPMSHVYFPLTCFISQVFTLEGRSGFEVGLVGAEGMLGSSLLFGVNVAPGRARVHGAGSALRLEVAQFSRELTRSPALKETLNRYLYVVASQLTQTAACSRFHFIPARLARWLLMTRDRANSDEFYLTHAVAAYILGVRREGVTEAASLLQARKLIRYQRGRVTIINAPALEAAACKCYAAMRRVYTQIMT
jgi:CRP-like cAMP-binding protein